MKKQNFKLTDQQINFFQTFGYLSFPGLLADRIDEIDREFEAVWEAHGGGHSGKPHEGTARSCIVPFIDQSEVLSSLLDDPRILGIATSLLGDDFNYLGSDGNYYVGDTGWHSDGGHRLEDPMHIKIAFYLDPLTRDTGALRVIPGSHRLGEGYADRLTKQIRDSQDLWGIHGRDIPAVAFETQPADVVMFNHNTKHAAFGGGTRRRMFTMNLCERYPDNRLAELREYIGKSARFWIDRKYGEKMVRTAGPERRRHLEQVMANDGHLAELARQARERMTEPSRG
ncbi:MAG: phytanoyl-CoA dioxygenase family protein [Candidatus Poribacteria bacterium]|nr:phytanoyl-CoA dioxygenase family protein [Candidatus Poribacteria bacterium]